MIISIRTKKKEGISKLSLYEKSSYFLHIKALKEIHQLELTHFCGCRRSVLVHCTTSVKRSTLTIQNFILTYCSPSSRWQKWRWKFPIQIQVHVFLTVSPLFSCCCWKSCWHHDDSCKMSTKRLHSYISISQQLSVVNVIPNEAVKWSQCRMLSY